MQRLKGFGIKLIGIGIITFSVFGIFYDANIGNLLLMTVIIASLSYIGDLFILPRINKFFAVIADFALYMVLFFLLGNIVIDEIVSLILSTFLASLLAAAGDAVFHIYMQDYVFDRRYVNPLPGKYQTEFAKEADIKSQNEKDKKIAKTS